MKHKRLYQQLLLKLILWQSKIKEAYIYIMYKKTRNKIRASMGG